MLNYMLKINSLNLISSDGVISFLFLQRPPGNLKKYKKRENYYASDRSSRCMISSSRRQISSSRSISSSISIGKSSSSISSRISSSILPYLSFLSASLTFALLMLDNDNQSKYSVVHFLYNVTQSYWIWGILYPHRLHLLHQMHSCSWASCFQDHLAT